MATAAPYSSPGGYRSGAWVVAFPNGGVGIYDKSTLPKPATGVRYYWIGDSVKRAQAGIYSALGALNLSADQIPVLDSQMWQAIQSGKPLGIAGNIPLTPGLSTPKTPGQAPGATYQNSPGVFGALADAITSTTDFLKLIAWLFHPRNVLRAVEFLTGMIFIGFGAWAALQARGEGREGFTTGEAAISRSGLGRVARELGAAARGTGSGESGRRPAKPAAAPHRERRTALRVRYQREQNVASRRTKARRQRS